MSMAGHLHGLFGQSLRYHHRFLVQVNLAHREAWGGGGGGGGVVGERGGGGGGGGGGRGEGRV